MSATDLLGDAIPQVKQWLPTEREVHDFMNLHCSNCALGALSDDGCPIWAETTPATWIVGPNGRPTCTEFREAA